MSSDTKPSILDLVHTREELVRKWVVTNYKFHEYRRAKLQAEHEIKDAKRRMDPYQLKTMGNDTARDIATLQATDLARRELLAAELDLDTQQGMLESLEKQIEQLTLEINIRSVTYAERA